jgi:hypothetical protein
MGIVSTLLLLKYKKKLTIKNYNKLFKSKVFSFSRIISYKKQRRRRRRRSTQKERKRFSLLNPTSSK